MTAYKLVTADIKTGDDRLIGAPIVTPFGTVGGER